MVPLYGCVHVSVSRLGMCLLLSEALYAFCSSWPRGHVTPAVILPVPDALGIPGTISAELDVNPAWRRGCGGGRKEGPEGITVREAKLPCVARSSMSSLLGVEEAGISALPTGKSTAPVALEPGSSVITSLQVESGAWLRWRTVP